MRGDYTAGLSEWQAHRSQGRRVVGFLKNMSVSTLGAVIHQQNKEKRQECCLGSRSLVQHSKSLDVMFLMMENL